jgi:OFA family oxalate/formate antiporter-like MFS transporter
LATDQTLAARGTTDTTRPQRFWAALTASTVINLPFGSLYAFSVFLKPIEALLGVTRAELSFVFGLATIFFTLGMNVAPYLFRLASAPVLVAGCAAAGTLGIALAATAGGVAQLGLGYGVLFGLGGGAAYIIVQQGVNVMLRAHRGLVNGYVVSLYPAGAMIAAPLFGLGIATFGVRGTLGGLAATVAIAGLIAVALVIHSGMALKAQASEASAEAGERYGLVFWQIAAVFLLAAAAGLTVLSQAAGMISAYGGTTALALFATTWITGCITAARIGGGWLADRFAIPTIMAGSHVIALAGATVLTLWPGPMVAVATLSMVGMGYGFISGSTAAAVACYWHVNAFGRIASRLYIAWGLAAISLPVVAGWLYDLTGGYRTAVILAGCGNLAGIAIALTLPRRRVS